MNEQRFGELLEGHFNRDLTPWEKTELQGILLTRASARERFWQEAEWHALFCIWGEQETGRTTAVRMGKSAPRAVVVGSASSARQTPSIKASPSRVANRRGWKAWAAGVVAVASLIVLGLVFGPKAGSRPLASLDRVSDAVWGKGSAGLKRGDKLSAQVLRLERGYAVIAFARGARVVLEGPAEFELLNDNAGRLRSGKLRAQLSKQAEGFKITTPQFSAVDTGTEFGCSVAHDGSGEVHVFDGAVLLNTASANKAGESLKSNQAARIAFATVSKIDIRRDAFVSEDELKRRELVKKGDVFGAWQMSCLGINEDPAAIVHLEFEGLPNRVLSNGAKGAPDSDATVVGGKEAVGRWSNKGALNFVQSGDRLEFPIRGTYESLTLLAWIRPDAVKSPQYLARSAGAQRLGHVDWYLHLNGMIGLGVRNQLHRDPHRGWSTVHSQSALQPGKWTLVASVVDGKTATITHYHDGKVVGQGNIAGRIPLRIDRLHIGAEKPLPLVPDTQYRGRMDELAVFSRALGPAEIRQFFENGRPDLE